MPAEVVATPLIIPGGPELIILAVIVVLLFGAKKIPQLSRGIGQAIPEFKRGRSEGGVNGDEAENQ